MTDEFECAQWVDRQYPDAVGQWPDFAIEASFEALMRLLIKHPYLKVIEDRGICIGEDHPRFTPWNDYKFILIRTVKLGTA